MRFTKTVPCPPYTPLGAIESSRGLRPSRTLQVFSTVWGRSQWERPFSVYTAEERGDSVSLMAQRAGWGSGGAVGRADGHLLPRILSSGYALFKSLPQPRVGSADRSFPGAPGKPENSGSPIYASRIRDRIGGSRWGQAQPAGQTSVGVWGSAKRSGASPSQPESAMPTHDFQKILEIRRPWPL